MVSVERLLGEDPQAFHQEPFNGQSPPLQEAKKHPPATSPRDPGKRRGAAIGLVAGLTFGGKLLFAIHVASAAKLHRD
jgi:hypothetical protein